MKVAFRSSVHTLIALSLVALSAVAVAAQKPSRDLRVVSARAGGVNYVFGDVKVKGPGKGGWETLDTSHDLDNGDVVATGATGLAEVLLNPGSYLRLGTNSEFEMFDSSLEELRVKLVRGSIVIEASGFDNDLPLVKIDTPHTQVSIVKSGVYRINVLPGGATEVAVEKGRALVGKSELAALIVKGGKVARVGRSSAAEIAKLDKKNRDALDRWSKDRGEELAEANRTISRRQANTLLASLNQNDRFFFPAQFSSSGVWYFDPRRGCYTFLPFGYGWRSPYGHWYDSALNWWPGGCYSCGTSTYYGGSRGGNYGGGNNQGGNNGGGNTGGGQVGGGKTGGWQNAGPGVISRPAPMPATSAPMPAPSHSGGNSLPTVKTQPIIDP